LLRVVQGLVGMIEGVHDANSATPLKRRQARTEFITYETMDGGQNSSRA
jgi:hypothetical protein